MIIGIGICLREPNYLLGVNALAVNDSAYLSVASARIKAYATALEMSADGRRRRDVGGCVFIAYRLYREGLLVNSFHKVNVKVAKTAVGVCLFYPLADSLAACDDYLISARYPKDRLYYSLDKSEVLLVLTDAVAEDTRFICRGISTVTFNGDYNILTVILSCFSHITAND